MSAPWSSRISAISRVPNVAAVPSGVTCANEAVARVFTSAPAARRARVAPALWANAAMCRGVKPSGLRASGAGRPSDSPARRRSHGSSGVVGGADRLEHLAAAAVERAHERREALLVAGGRRARVARQQLAHALGVAVVDQLEDRHRSD